MAQKMLTGTLERSRHSFHHSNILYLWTADKIAWQYLVIYTKLPYIQKATYPFPKITVNKARMF